MMRKIFALVFLLALACAATAQTFVSSASSSNSGSNSSISATLTLTSGNSALVFCRTGGGAGVSFSVTDTGSNTWYGIGLQNDANIGNTELFYSNITTTTTGDSISCNYSTSESFRGIIVTQTTALPGGLDVNLTGAVGSGSTTLTTGSYSTSLASEIIFLCAAQDTSGGATYSAGNFGGVSGTNVTQDSLGYAGCQFAVLSSTQTAQVATLVSNQSHNWNYAVASFNSNPGSVIHFHASTSSAANSGSSFTVNLPAVASNDCVLMAVVSTNKASGGTPYANVSGWNTIIDVDDMAVFQRIYTGGGTTIGITPQNGAEGSGGGAKHTVVGLSYSGTSLTNCIDDSNYTIWDQTSAGLKGNGTFYSRGAIAVAPPVSPTNTTDVLVVGFLSSGNSSGWAADSSGLTYRKEDACCFDDVWMGDRILAVGTPTASYGGSINSGDNAAFSLALLPASGGSSVTQARQPTLGGVKPGTLDFTSLYPQNGDLACVTTDSSATVTTGGYSAAWAQSPITFQCRRWSTGDATTFAVSGTSNHDVWIFHNPAQSSSTNYVYTDACSSSTTSTGGLGGTAIIPSVSEAVANELTFGLFSQAANNVPGGGVPSSTFDSGSYTVSSPAYGIKYFTQQNPAIPTGSYSLAISGAANITAGFATMRIGPGSGGGCSGATIIRHYRTHIS